MRSVFSHLLFAVLCVGCSSTESSSTGKPQPVAQTTKPTPTAQACSGGAAGSLYALSATRLNQQEQFNMCELQGNVALLVNSASECGYTGQYKPIQALYDKYQSQKFIVVAFPSNSFKQETGTEKQVSEFCTTSYQITFPLMKIAPVVDKGSDVAQPIYKWLYAQPGQSKQVSWNFEKFLIGRDGKVAARFDPAIDPATDPSIEDAIKKALAK